MATSQRPRAPRRPAALFKYLPPERTDFLRTRLLRFTPPSALNDPFDASPVASLGSGAPPPAPGSGALAKVRPALDAVLEKMADTLLNRNALAQRVVSQTYGILSLSNRHDSLLMWAHYAHDHQGFVIQLRAAHRWLGPVRPVRYGVDRPVVAPFIRQTKPRRKSDDVTFLFQKGPDWAYEGEWRMVRKLADAHTVKPPVRPKVHLFRVPRGALEAVYVGARMPAEARAQLAQFLALPVNRAVRVIQVRLSPRRFELEFDAIPREALLPPPAKKAARS